MSPEESFLNSRREICNRELSGPPATVEQQVAAGDSPVVHSLWRGHDSGGRVLRLQQLRRNYRVQLRHELHLGA